LFIKDYLKAHILYIYRYRFFIRYSHTIYPDKVTFLPLSLVLRYQMGVLYFKYELLVLLLYIYLMFSTDLNHESANIYPNLRVFVSSALSSPSSSHSYSFRLPARLLLCLCLRLGYYLIVYRRL
jgi:hypothetical protein